MTTCLVQSRRSQTPKVGQKKKKKRKHYILKIYVRYQDHLVYAFLLSGVSADQPIVFHTRIRSSGYGQKIKAKSAIGKVAAKAPAAAASSRLRKEYPLSCGPLIVEQMQSCPMPPLAPILHLTYSGDAKTLAACCADGTVHTYRLPVARHQVTYIYI